VVAIMSLAPTSAARSTDRITSSGRRSAAALYGIYEISKILTKPARLEATLSGVIALLSSFLDMRHGLIALLDDAGNPDVAVGSGWSEATAKRYFDRLPERAIGQIVATKMPLVVANVGDDPVFAQWQSSDRGEPWSFIGVPIKDRDQVIGAITITQDRLDHVPVRDEDVRFLVMIANLIGQTVRLHRLIARDRDRLMSEQHRLEKVLETKREASTDLQSGTQIVGDSRAIQDVLHKIRIVARSHSTVLLRGESGTGKELCAQALHNLSPRKKAPFISLNCAALPENVLESELFGHEKGAFTGAIALRKGRFELADGGTLFLDEIGDVSPAFQAKLLRVLQEGEFERVGGMRTLKVNVRLVAATNRNLEEAVAKGEFRADLYYRIAVVPIFLPPLRDRKDDIPLLAREFLRRFNAENGTDLRLTDDALSVLTSCYFPGNVRELENCVRRTATLAHGSNIVALDFACRSDSCLSALLWNQHRDNAPGRGGFIPLPVARNQAAMPPAVMSPRAPSPGPGAGVPASGESEERTERQRLVKAMDDAGWVQAKAARLLGLTPRQVGYALRKHGVEIKKF
jgi:Nif-specific regulatory protein